MRAYRCFNYIALLGVVALCSPRALAHENIYHKNWIDFNKNGTKDVFEDPTRPVEERVEDLLSQMTLEEKTCQLATLYGTGKVLKDNYPTENWKNEVWKDGIGNIDEQSNGLKNVRELSYPYVNSIKNKQAIQRWFVEETRLGIPVDFTNEGIRGLCHDMATMFPAQCGQGSSWNRALIREIARVTAEEAVALGYTNVYSPILDLSRDPRWGRVVECYSEDPYLAGELGKEAVMELQRHGIVASPKHFAVYSVPVGGRDEGTRTDPHVAPREMKTLLLEPFRKAIQEGGALGVMASYNDYDGEPIISSTKFLTELLRQQWGFKGYVVSDSRAVEHLRYKHHVASSDAEAAAMAVNAGMNIRTDFTPPADFVLPLREAYDLGLVSSEVIDERVREVLRVKFFQGLFDNPYKGNIREVDKIVHSQEHQDLSMKAALQSYVLLKNENHLLPLKKDYKRIAVIGPNADEQDFLKCRYGPANTHITTVLDGIRAYLPDCEVEYAKGCDILDENFPESELYEIALTADEQKRIDEAVEVAKRAEVAILVLGGNELTVREEYSRTDLNLSGRQEELLRAVYETGTPVVLVLIDGRAVTINWANKYIPAILYAGFPGEKLGESLAQVLFGDYTPGGKLAVTFPKTVGQIPLAFPAKPHSDSKGYVRVSGSLYPFGFGLSYTEFEYSDLQLDTKCIGPEGHVTVSFKVKNVGPVKGDEVVQLYLRDEKATVTTYEKVLRGFERITLNPGEERELQFVLSPRDLAIWDINNNFTVEEGWFKVMVGKSSEDIVLSDRFEVVKRAAKADRTKNSDRLTL